jgi:peptidoglycan/LPS O-acetylase OafA/YrhL
VATLTGSKWIEPVYWTLAYEFAFYLAIGLLFGVLFREKLKWLYLLIVGFLVLSVVLGWVSFFVLLFVMGTAVFRRKANLDHDLVTALIVLVCAVTIGAVGGLPIALTGLATAMIIRFGENIHVDGVPGKVLSYLGTISYSLYLVHIPIAVRVINLEARFVHGQLEHLCASAVGLAVSLAFAHAFYMLCERPVQRRARNMVHLRKISLVTS